MRGFDGPRDIFRNPEAIWRHFEPTNGDSPFDLVLSTRGDDFAVMGMHFKLGLYEHQSAGALQGLIDLLAAHPEIAANPDAIADIRITAYEPAFGIIGDPAKRDPRTRQSADHSMVFIVSRMLRKAIDRGSSLARDSDALWKQLMLLPEDFTNDAIFDDATRALMDKIEFEHGGEEYDRRYPDGIPTSMVIRMTDETRFESGLVMYPAGHARDDTADLRSILDTKFRYLGEISHEDPAPIIERMQGLPELDAVALQLIWDFEILDLGGFS